MKNFFLGVLAVLIIGGLAFGAYYLGTKKQNTPNNVAPQLSPTITTQVTITPTITPSASTPTPTLKVENEEELIKTALFQKNNWPADNSINVTVSTNDGTYASGTAGGQGGGGYFFAEKVGGVWEIVADGNGTISCSIFTKYPNFPKTLIPECYDEKTQNSIKR